MSMRHTMKARRVLTAVAITTGLALTVAGCGGDGGDGKSKTESSSTSTGKERAGEGDPKESEFQPPTTDPVLAEVTGGDDNTTLIISSAVRDEGGFLTINGKIRNGRDGNWVPNSWRGDEKELSNNGSSMAGASLVDKEGRKKYLILRDTEGRCLCTQFSGAFKENEEKAWFAQFPAPPAGIAKVDFQIADMPVASIEISDGE